MHYVLILTYLVVLVQALQGINGFVVPFIGKNELVKLGYNCVYGRNYKQYIKFAVTLSRA
jgi:hypothetical protein